MSLQQKIYSNLWKYTPEISEPFTNLLDFIEKKKNVKINFETYPKTDDNQFSFNSFADQSCISFKPVSYTYYFALHEIFHYITSKEENKLKFNFNLPENIFQKPTLNSEDEILNEIKTCFMSSMFINDIVFKKNVLMHGVFGFYHEFTMNYTVALCSIQFFGKYKKMKFGPQTDHYFNENEIALQLIKENYFHIGKQRLTYTQTTSYREPVKKDWDLVAKLSRKAVDELIEDQFIDSQCNVLDMEKWKF